MDWLPPWVTRLLGGSYRLGGCIPTILGEMCAVDFGATSFLAMFASFAVFEIMCVGLVEPAFPFVATLFSVAMVVVAPGGCQDIGFD